MKRTSASWSVTTFTTPSSTTGTHALSVATEQRPSAARLRALLDPRLPRPPAAADPQRAARPRAPHRQGVRPPGGARSGAPVVVRLREPLLRPRPREQATPLARTDDPVARHVRPARRGCCHGHLPGRTRVRSRYTHRS